MSAAPSQPIRYAPTPTTGVCGARGPDGLTCTAYAHGPALAHVADAQDGHATAMWAGDTAPHYSAQPYQINDGLAALGAFLQSIGAVAS